MSFLQYRGGDYTDRDTPSRLYARLDPDPTEDVYGFVLDGVDARWFDTMDPQGPWVTDYREESLEANVSILELHPDRAQEKGLSPEDEKTWWEVTLSDPQADGDVRQFVNLFAAPLLHELQDLRPVDYERANQLDAVHDISGLDDADEGELEAVLMNKADSAGAAAVYDVGQGACQALVDGCSPALYLDFGGGCLWNARTYPTDPAGDLREFCFKAQPPIVLSHWDADHWATANRDTRALGQSWIVPRQATALGSSHLAFLNKLLTNGTVHVWPWALASVTAGSLTVDRCTGTTRNDDGLAATWHDPSGSGRMLFPADAGYSHIPSATGDFTSIVVPHHGGRTRSTAPPPSPDGAPHGRLVYSYGRGNTYGHALASVEADHSSAGWSHELRTETNRPRLGHVHLYWDASAPDADPCCHGAHCQLDCSQR